MTNWVSSISKVFYAGNSWNSLAIGQCNIAPPVNQEPSIGYSLSGAVGPALSARYHVSAMQKSWLGILKMFFCSFSSVGFLLWVSPFLGEQLLVMWARAGRGLLASWQLQIWDSGNKCWLSITILLLTSNRSLQIEVWDNMSPTSWANNFDNLKTSLK